MLSDCFLHTVIQGERVGGTWQRKESSDKAVLSLGRAACSFGNRYQECRCKRKNYKLGASHIGNKKKHPKGARSTYPAKPQ